MGERKTVLRACPVADGLNSGCCRGCGGGWPGTTKTTEQLTKILHTGRLNPQNMPCGPLEDKARFAIAELNGDNPLGI